MFYTGMGNIFMTALDLCIAIAVLWTMAMTLMNGLQCGTHISALWSVGAATYQEYCIYVFPFEMGFAISNFLLDFLILVLPIQKVGVGDPFSER